MADEKKKEFDFGTLGIIIGILIMVLSIVWVTLANLHDDDNPNEVTWVG